MIPYLPRLPIKKFSQLGIAARKLSSLADKLVHAKSEAHAEGLESGKDLISLLVRANAKEAAKTKLSDEEVRSEIAYVLSAWILVA